MYDEYHIRKKAKQDSNLDPGHWLGLIALLVILFLICTRACAQNAKARIDTMYCNPTCIEKYITTTTESGKIKIFAVYNSKQQDVSDIIPVPQSVYTYIKVCKQNGITPSLAIRLRNGIITGLMRYKPKYVKRK